MDTFNEIKQQCNTLEKVRLWVKDNLSTDINYEGDEGDEQIQYNNYMKLVKFFIEEFSPAKKINNMDKLHFAARAGYDRYLQQQIIPNIDLQDPTNGNTALHFAASQGHLNTVRVLLEKKPNTNIKNNNGAYALTNSLFIPTLHDQSQVAKKESIFQDLLQVNPNALDYVGNNGENTAHKIAASGLAQAMKLVIDKAPALLTKPRNNGDYPIHVAALNYNHKLLATLVNIAELNRQKGRNGFTALHIVSREGNLEGINLCANKHANINALDNAGRTPLMLASDDKVINKLKSLGGQRVTHSVSRVRSR